MSYILRITSIKEADLNFMTKAIINLATYLSFYLKRLFAINNICYMAKTVFGLLITYNKSNLTNKLHKIF